MTKRATFAAHIADEVRHGMAPAVAMSHTVRELLTQEHLTGQHFDGRGDGEEYCPLCELEGSTK
jgi:hypothetical protein